MSKWRQGEHVVVIGATGSGKTWLIRRLMNYRKYKIIILTKADRSLWPHYRTINSASQIDYRRHASYRLFPKFEAQWAEIVTACDRAWNEKGWAICFDETYYVEHQLHLGMTLIKLLTQGRSEGITVICGVQRPAWITRFALSEPTHVFCFRLGDKRDLKAIAEGVSAEYAAIIPTLAQYEAAYYNKITGVTKRLRAEELEDLFGEYPR